MKEHERINILKHTSVNDTLVELSIGSCYLPLGNTLFEYLTVKEGVPCTLPKLEKLSIRTLIGAEDGAVPQMAMSRCVDRAMSTSLGVVASSTAIAPGTVASACPPRQLKRLGLPFAEKLSELDRSLDIRRLNDLVRSGLRVSFETLNR